ncbi:hypothetical protein [Pseudonocardia sp. HH130630-07]|uniref:hypothetical protein n=1 Tax=Pseudonocardia sp. HH130630-07 TaxID=1690815 RepID=UPI0008150A7E|nr:hypothetical protein [Pseudonocardia sp. HH130630-07]ANY05449.1 hypothetical protein AFB00_03040 [Pseudonocardia sp. HH130630-07]
MRAPDTGDRETSEPGHHSPDPTGGPWPTVRPPSTRAVLAVRAAALGVLGWFAVVYTVASDVLSRAPHLLGGLLLGAVLCVTGAVLLWTHADRVPARVEPRRGPGMGLVADRVAARRLLLSGATPDGEQRRLVAVEVLADAKLPLVTGAMFGVLGPLVVAVAHTSGPLGPLTAALIVLLLAALAWRTWSAYRLHRAADGRHTVPRFAGSGAPWRPWP